MTGTIRATNPRALIRDRSNSKSGMDKSMRKAGGGAHNWGNMEDQIEGEMYDDGEEEPLDDVRKSASVAPSSPGQDRRLSVSTASTGTSSNLTEEEKEKAIQYRAHALRAGDLDLAAIARTSGGIVATSPPK
ncbi:hypothetical protein FRB96_009553 [Tulasnella sp. 330]|nr:hypothetical protein FRB96_009553 [Tulasnella sp. 330]KAG8880125.1 hypothetical protein FRB97_001056 [Tulasnella sp. 331]KAG8886749.1 hypothetical protein FRB98_001050 [Tulasnella sp. 332]